MPASPTQQRPRAGSRRLTGPDKFERAIRDFDQIGRPFGLGDGNIRIGSDRVVFSDHCQMSWNGVFQGRLGDNRVEKPKRRLDGTVVYPDGVERPANGHFVFPDGLVVLPDLTAHYPDGIVIQSDGTMIRQNGTLVPGQPRFSVLERPEMAPSPRRNRPYRRSADLSSMSQASILYAISFDLYPLVCCNSNKKHELNKLLS